MKQKLLSLLLFFSCSLLLSMEQKKQKKMLSAIIPIELVDYSMQLGVGVPIPDEAKHYYDNNQSCFVVMPLIREGFSSNEIGLNDLGKWHPPINLNPCEFTCWDEEDEKTTDSEDSDSGSDSDSEDEAEYGFSVQCWKTKTSRNTVKGFGYLEWTKKYTDYHIDNDLSKNRYMATTPQETTDCLFDGSNDNNTIIVGGNKPLQTRKFRSDKAKAKEPRYSYFIGKFTQAGVEHYKNDVFEDTKRKRFAYQAPTIEGILTALALHKTMDRFVVADDVISFLDIIEKQSEEQSDTKDKLASEQKLDVLLLGNSRTLKENFSHICFLTPEVVLGVSKSGFLYSFGLNAKTGAVSVAKQTLVNKNNEEIKLTNFAVDSCDTHHVVLQTDDNKIIYWDLKDCHNRDLRKSGLSILAPEKQIDWLWLYNNNLCLGMYLLRYMSQQKTYSCQSPAVLCYELHNFDVTVKNIEK